MSHKISVTLPDDLYGEALRYATKNHRSVPNLCSFALHLYMSKYASLHAPKNAIPGHRNGPAAGADVGRIQFGAEARAVGPVDKTLSEDA